MTDSKSTKPAVPDVGFLATPMAAEVPQAAPETSQVAPETEAPVATLTLAEVTPTARPRAFYLASQWHIMPAAGEDMIEATNNQTGDKYEGPISDFNEMLRGN